MEGDVVTAITPLIPTDTSDLTNGAGYQTSSDVATAISGKQDTLTAGTGIDITNNVISATGGGGTSDYSDLTNKPQINSITLSGNKSLTDLGIQGTITAGSNITLTGSTISATDTTYSA
jgi:hypothetical protein